MSPDDSLSLDNSSAPCVFWSPWDTASRPLPVVDSLVVLLLIGIPYPPLPCLPMERLSTPRFPQLPPACFGLAGALPCSPYCSRLLGRPASDLYTHPPPLGVPMERPLTTPMPPVAPCVLRSSWRSGDTSPSTDKSPWRPCRSLRYAHAPCAPLTALQGMTPVPPALLELFVALGVRAGARAAVRGSLGGE